MRGRCRQSEVDVWTSSEIPIARPRLSARCCAACSDPRLIISIASRNQQARPSGSMFEWRPVYSWMRRQLQQAKKSGPTLSEVWMAEKASGLLLCCLLLCFSIDCEQSPINAVVRIEALFVPGAFGMPAAPMPLSNGYSDSMKASACCQRLAACWCTV